MSKIGWEIILIGEGSSRGLNDYMGGNEGQRSDENGVIIKTGSMCT